MAIVPEPLASADLNAHDRGMEARIAVLEEIASSTCAVLKEIRDDIRDIRTGLRDIRGDIRSVRDCQDADLRLVFGAPVAVTLGLASLVAEGFHWI
jgi:hypothetical protein